MPDTKQQRIGFIGLGAMGAGMAANLLKAGFRVRGFDINPAAMKRLGDQGGDGAASPAETADGAELLIVMVANSDQADSVLFGDNGAVAKLSTGATVVLCSTVAPQYVRDLEARLETTGHRLLDAPVSGGAVGAEGGALTIMASGSPDAFAATEAALAAVSKKVYRLGEAAGAGSSVKMVNQLLAGVHIASAAEAMALGTRAGADPRVLFEVISNSAGNSWMFSNRVPHMLEGDYTPLSAVDIFVKDLGIVLESGKSMKFPLPIASTALQMFLMAASAGLGREDDAAVVKVYEKLAGIDVAAAAKGKSDA